MFPSLNAKKAMDVSILISTYNGAEDVRLLLDSILALETESLEIEVIIRDDNSSDDTVHIVECDYPWVKLIKGSTTSLGFGRSTNIVMEHARGDTICCVNQDTLLHPHFILEGVRLLRQYPAITGVSTNMIMPWVMPVDEFSQVDMHAIPTYEYQLTSYGIVRYSMVKNDHHASNFMSGGGFFIRSSFVRQEGYIFDPDIYMYCEDTELSLRLQRADRLIKYCPQSIIYHNQASLKLSSFEALVKLIGITRNRFAVFARISTPRRFAGQYILLLVGIVKKVEWLGGLSTRDKKKAYLASSGVAFLFFLFFPFWFIFSLVTTNEKDKH